MVGQIKRWTFFGTQCGITILWLPRIGLRVTMEQYSPTDRRSEITQSPVEYWISCCSLYCITTTFLRIHKH